MTDLTIGVVSQGTIHDQLLLEMLDHQGFAYQVIGGQTGEAHTYPVVLLSRDSADAYNAARAFCRSESDIVIAEKAVDLEKALSLLQGIVSDQRDNFELAVNYEEEKLLSCMRTCFFERNLPLVRKWYWPRMSPIGCVLTHDIDWFVYSPFHKQVLRQSANPVRLIRLFYGSMILRKDYGWNIPEMVKLETEYGFRSTYLFQTSYSGVDLFRESIALLKRGSFEMALHGAHSSHKDAGALRAELDSFRETTGVSARGLRYHILKFDPNKTWDLECAAGLTYDATFYYNEFFGFRAGVCFPYRPLRNGMRLPILELPTGYMDWTALHRESGMREQVDMFERSKAAVEAHHGVFVVNFHNTYINKETFPKVYEVFGSLLETAKAKRYWVATADECTRWWNARSAAQINPRLQSDGQVICSQTEVDVVLEREGGRSETIPSTSPAVERLR